MLPAWATVVMALVASAVGGVVGSLVTTRMRIRHEREEQRKVRLIDAATDFTSHLAAGRGALQGIERHIQSRPGKEGWVRLAGASIDEATSKAASVALLFGDGAQSSEAARVAVDLARNLLEQLRDPNPDWRDVAELQRRLRDAEAIFNNAVTAVVERIEPSPYERPGSLHEALERLGID